MNDTIADLASRAACPVAGNSDLYGLGMRIGIYIQMFTVQISGMSSSLFRAEDHLGQATVIFILAVGTVLFQVIKKAAIEPVEVFPIITLLIAQAAVCRVPYWRAQLTVFLYVGELVGLISLFVWFWWRGMDTLPRSCDNDYAFFFAKVSIWNWYRKFNQATSVLIAISGFGGALFYIAYFCARSAWSLWRLIKRGTDEHDDKEEEQAMPSAGGIDIAINIGMVVYVEMALKWNKITGVHDLSSPGQFMPLFIALAQLIATLFQLAKHLLKIAIDEEAPVLYYDEEDLECSHHNHSPQEEQAEEPEPGGQDQGIVLINMQPSV